MSKRHNAPAARRPPAYQEYASDVLGDERYYTLEAAERGLYHSMRLAAWANDSVPADPGALALALRLDRKDVERLLPAVRQTGYVLPCLDDPTRLYIPELQEQMSRLMDRRAQLMRAASRGGKRAHRPRPAVDPADEQRWADRDERSEKYRRASRGG